MYNNKKKNQDAKKYPFIISLKIYPDAYVIMKCYCRSFLVS